MRNLRFPHFIEKLHEAVVNHEGDGHIQGHATQPRYCPFVKRSQSLVFVNLDGTVQRVFVLGCFQPLHSCFDNVDGGVTKDGGSASRGTHQPGDKGGDLLALVFTAVPVLQGLHDEEANRLVAALLEDGGRHPLVDSVKTLFFNNL